MTSSQSGTEKVGVLFVHSATQPPLGADTWVQSQIAAGLDKRRVDVHVACAFGDPDTPTPTFAVMQPIAGIQLVRIDLGRERSTFRTCGPSPRGAGRRSRRLQCRSAGPLHPTTQHRRDPHHRSSPRCRGRRPAGSPWGSQMPHPRPRRFRPRLDERHVAASDPSGRCRHRDLRVRRIQHSGSRNRLESRARGCKRDRHRGVDAATRPRRAACRVRVPARQHRDPERLPPVPRQGAR